MDGVDWDGQSQFQLGNAIEEIFAEWLKGQLFIWSERGSAFDLPKIVERARYFCDALDMVWREDRLPEYVHDQLEFLKEG